MTYHVSFRTEEYEGKRIYSWFVVNDEGTTLQAGFPNKDAALAWAMRSFGWRS